MRNPRKCVKGISDPQVPSTNPEYEELYDFVVTGNVAPSDKGGLVYDSEMLNQATEIIGFPIVQLRTSVDAAQADWIVRLEDVQPDGSVTR